MATSRIILRELRRADAPELLRLSQLPEIAPHVWQAPATSEAFERFIETTRERRAHGTYACFAVVPTSATAPVGLFELRALDPYFFHAELSFFLERTVWGTGAFVDAARLLREFAFQAIGVHRIEARAEVDNDRANGALRKIGAVQEGRLRASFVRDGRAVDQYLWSILEDD